MKITDNTRGHVKMKIILSNKNTCKVSIKIKINFNGCTVMFIRTEMILFILMNLVKSKANSTEIEWTSYNNQSMNNFQKTIKISNTRAGVKMKITFCNKVTCRASIKIKINFNGYTVMFF